MGAVQNVIDRLRRAFVMDKERGGDLLARGSTSPTYPDSGYDLLQAYGYDALSDYLRLEHDLLSRYVDYEEMDDYPEIACVSGNLRLLVATLPRNVVSSEEEDAMGFMSVQALTVRELYEEYEAGRSDCLYVFALDHKQGRVRVVKAIGPRKTGEAVQVYRVIYESYRHEQAWSVTCTGDHLFMLRDGSYRAATDLEPGDRLMPCTLRTSPLGYSTVYEPLKKTPSASPVYTNVHGLVAEAVCGRPLTDQEIVHHKDRDKTNFRPVNLEITSTRAHVREHVQSEEDEERRIELVSEGLRKKWADPSFKKRVSESHRFRDPRWLEAERAGKHKHREARGELSDAHRAAIAKGRTIPLAKDVVDATLRASASINEAASRLGVSWSTLVRRMDQYGLDRNIIGSNLGGPQPGDGEYLNHRVVSVEKVGFEDVYDLEVPEYHNFAVGTDDGGFVFVHNSAVDVYADDASQPDTQLQRTIWITSPDKTLQGVLDDLFFTRLRMDEEIWELTRSLVKYGNDYEEILVTQEGVVGLNFLPAPTVRRVEGPRGELYGFVQDFRGRFGYCLASGSRVWGVGGLQQIETFEAGQQVVGLVEGRPKPLVVRQRHSNGTKRVFRLRTLHRQVFLTEDHPVLLHDVSGARIWTKVRDLKIIRQQGGKKNLDYTRTSKIVISTRMAPGEIPEWASVWKNDPFDVVWGDKGSPTKLDLPIRPTEDFCRLFGFLLGDGWLEDRKAYYARGEYEELNDRYDALLVGLGLSLVVREIPTGGFQTVVSSVQFCRFLVALGWIDGASEKRIPPWMFALPEGHREALLRGFLDADGWTNCQPGRRPRHFFEIANYDLARDLKNLIDGLGYICGNISSRTREPGTVIHGKVVQTQKPCFTVSFTDEKFAEPFVAETVLEIEYFEDAEVFDLEVDDDAHNFVADGVVVHNSPQEFQKLLAQRTDAIRSMMQPGGSTQWQGGGLLQQVSALETWEVAHFRLRGKHRRSVYGYCERATSKVSTPFGVKEIQHLKPGDVVYVMDNARMVGVKVLDVVCSGEKKIYSIKTRHRENFATAEHPVMVVSEAELLTYKSVSELRQGDLLVLPRPPEIDGLLTLTKNPGVFDRVRLTPEGVAEVARLRGEERYFYRSTGLSEIDAEADVFCTGGRSVGRDVFECMCCAVPELSHSGSFVTHGRCRENFVRCPEYVDEGLAWLFGLLLGDGWTSQGHDVGVAVSLDETLTEVIRSKFRAYGLEPKDHYQRVIDEGTGEETRVLRTLVVHSADFVDILHGLGFVNGSREKRVPQWVFESSRGVREAFVAGFVAADGWEVEQHGRRALRIELSNYDLVCDLKTLIDGLGWTCGNVCVRKARQGTVSTHPAMVGKVVNSGPGYILHFHTAPLFSGPFKLERVVSVTEQDTPPEPVYDIEVDSDCHNFVADGMVVHNSVLEPARWIWKRLMLLEDAAMIYRLQRAPERYAFYVDVGDLPPGEALAFVNKMRQQHRKKRFVNPSTGKLDLKFDPLPVAHDTPIPLLDGRTITIAEMARERSEGRKHWVYSIDSETGAVSPGEVSWVGRTREQGRALRITFDDGGIATMAPDHPIMLRSGGYREACLLKVGDRVKPLYRKVSSHEKGDGLDGYELVFDPAISKYRYTHRVVAGALGLREEGQVAHHKNFDKRNNDPSNLEGLWKDSHVALHAELGHLGGKRIAELRKTDVELDKRLREASARNIRAFNATPERKVLTARTNSERDQAAINRKYNGSDLHKEHDRSRSEKKRVFWQDDERAAAARKAMTHVYSEEFVSGVIDLLTSGGASSAEEVVQQVNSGPLLRVVQDANPRKPIREVHRHFMLKVYRDHGCEDFADFKKVVGGNHRVLAIEEVDPCDHYCMTVEKHHNFALLLRDSEGVPISRSGVFVKNSQDEDFWVPVRKGVEGTRIEVLGGPSWQHMEDVEYFQNKLFSALKVPKAYLAQDENVARAVLSSEDVRFARSVLRVQREVKNGLSKIARTHLAALNIDPYATEYALHMTVPSAIFELAQLEVRNSRADLASRMREHVSLPWVLKNVYLLSDDDIETITRQRTEDTIREGKASAEVEKMSGMAQAEVEKAKTPPPGMESAPETPSGDKALRGLRLLERKLGALPLSKRGGISEEELFKDGRGAGRGVEKKLDAILKSNGQTAQRIKEVGGLLHDLAAASRGR
jgi:intein/homing endonuclease